MLKITMFSQADKVKGQGVGSAYLELIRMLEAYFPDVLAIKINKFSRADISHYHTINPTFYLSTFFKRRRGVRIGYVHFLPETLEGSIHLFAPFQKIFNWYVMSFYKRMDELVVVNPCFIPELVAAGCDEEKITYIPNFVSKDTFYEKNTDEKAQIRAALNFQEDDFVVVGVGQIQKRKGIDDFIHLAKTNPDIQFVWVGGFSFGKLTDGYEEYQEVYQNPPANLRFTGIIERTQMVDYYNIADVFLLPSYNELFPMSILEAFNCGAPVMVRDLDLYASVIDGYTLPCADADEMAEQLQRLRTDEVALHDLQEKSKAAAAYYSQDNVSQIWYRFYQDMYQKFQK